MSMQTQIHSLVIRVADEFKSLYSKIGSLSTLSTTDKSNLVAAINELKGAVASGAAINDEVSGSTTSTFSASKIVTLLDGLRTQIMGGADAAYDTLVELQQAIQNDSSGIAAIATAIDRRVRFDSEQVLSDEEQVQARGNIGAVALTDIGDTSIDFIAIFDTALAA
jgi:hypothetical protein